MAKPAAPILESVPQSETFCRGIKSIYEPLDKTRLQTRLMHILPGPYYHELVEVTLSIVNLEDQPKYDALSYTWGSLSPTETISLCGFPYKVTYNQFSAIRRLRLPDEERIIWMDATCINQADTAERSRQVSIMNHIYANGMVTRIWLGEPQPSWSEVTDEDWDNHINSMNSNSELILWMKHNAGNRPAYVSNEFKEIVENQPDGVLKGAIYFLEQLAQSQSLEIKHMPYCYLGEDGEPIHYRPFYQVLEMVLSLIGSPWWTRVWVLQESCLSQTTPIVHVGSQQFTILIFTRARRGWMGSYDSKLDLVPLSHIYDLLQFLTYFVRIAEYGTSMESYGARLSLGDLTLSIGLGMVEGKCASDKRDFVYGIMGVVDKDSRMPIDYSLEVSEVFALASWNVFIDRASGFEYLRQAVGVSAPDMPSWAIDWAREKRDILPDLDIFETKERQNKDSTRCFHTAGVLQVVGNKVDKILSVLETKRDLDLERSEQALNIVSSWAQQLNVMDALPDIIIQSCDEDDDDTPSITNFFTTIFREIIWNEQGEKTRLTYPSASASESGMKDILHWFKSLKTAYDTDDENLKLQMEEHKLTKDFDSLIDVSTMCFTEQGHLTMANYSVKAGDYLYHIKGCSVPLVLRRAEPFELSWVEEASDDKNGTETEMNNMIDPFSVVGQCYMRGAMGTDAADSTKEQIISLI